MTGLSTRKRSALAVILPLMYAVVALLIAEFDTAEV
jgi:hypothetical protein